MPVQKFVYYFRREGSSSFSNEGAHIALLLGTSFCINSVVQTCVTFSSNRQLINTRVKINAGEFQYDTKNFLHIFLFLSYIYI